MNNQRTNHKSIYQLLEAIWNPANLNELESIPWPEILDPLVYNHLGALVYALIRGKYQSLPNEVRQKLTEEFYLSVANNTHCLNHLAQVKETLTRLGTPFVLLKGAALATALYKDPSFRLLGDIDLLVPRKSVPACREVFISLGYQPAYVEHQPGSLLQHSNEEMFLPPSPFQNPVELHWHLLDVPYYLNALSMDWFWENTETLEISGDKYQVLNAEANLVYLPAHLALHHRFQGLYLLLDLALLIVQKQGRLDWKKVIHASQQFELLCSLGATLEQLARCWASLPLDDAFQILDATQPTAKDKRLFRLLSMETRTTTIDFYTTLVSLPDFSSRLRYAWVNLFPQPAYMVRRYGVKKRWHFPYWYLYRIVGGLSRIARILPRARKIDHSPNLFKSDR